MTSTSEKAIKLYNQGRLAEARRLAEDVLKGNPKHPDVLHFLAQIDLREGKAPCAVERLKKAIDLAPLNAIFHETMAEAYRRAYDLLRAEWESQLALRFDADLPDALNILGLVYRDQGKYKEAVDVFSRAIEQRASNIEALNNLATVFIRLGDYSLAQKYLHLYLKANPRSPASAWNNLGLALRGERRLTEAKEAFIKAGNYLPARFNLGHIFLLEDNLREGLALYEFRRKIISLGKNIGKPEWDGKPRPQKTLLVVTEQGLGDAILMSRFYPCLTSYFKRVFIQVPKALLRLMRMIDTNAEFILESDPVKFDLWCPSMSLPYLLKIDSIEQIPHKPWFNLPNGRSPGGKLRIGLNWAGNPSFRYDKVRSTHLKELELLLKVESVEWYSLHKGHLEDEAKLYGLPQPLKTAEDFFDSAAFINSLDMVISTETAIPNLSAALGITTCVLTAPDYDWRWKSWYRSAILCPQYPQGNWYGTICKTLDVIKTRLEGSSV